MTLLPPEEDQSLVRFLRENRPPIPASSKDLESQILQKISQENSPRSQSSLWFLGAAIACTLALGWGIERVFNPKPQLAATPEEVEAFLLESWHGSVNFDPDSGDSYLLVF